MGKIYLFGSNSALATQISTQLRLYGQLCSGDHKVGKNSRTYNLGDAIDINIFDKYDAILFLSFSRNTKNYQKNVIAIRQIVDQVNNKFSKPFIYMSSDVANLKNVSRYSRTKLECERILQNCSNIFILKPGIIFNPENMTFLGPFRIFLEYLKLPFPIKFVPESFFKSGIFSLTTINEITLQVLNILSNSCSNKSYVLTNQMPKEKRLSMMEIVTNVGIKPNGKIIPVNIKIRFFLFLIYPLKRFNKIALFYDSLLTLSSLCDKN